MNRVVIFDTTLRDGEQSPGATLHIEEKLEVARQLERLGVDVIEAGFPISSQGDFDAVRLIAEQTRNCGVCGLARANPDDIDRAAEAVRQAVAPRIHVFISSSDIHLMYQLQKNREEVLEQARAMVARAKRYVGDVEFSPMDASRSDWGYVYRMLEAAIEAGATTLNIPDTVGYATPEEYGGLIRGILNNVRGADKVIISTHTHDDLGLAVANGLAGILAGARQVECTINGIGERAGNASLEEIVMALRTRKDIYQLDTRIDATQIYTTSRLVSDLTGIVVQPNKAIVGANAFRHESGIHQDGVLKERSTYEIMDAAAVGVVGSHLVLGKHSGRHAFRKHLADLGYHLSEEDIGRAFIRFKELTDKKKVVADRDIEAIVADEMRISAEVLRLEHVQVTTGDHLVPTACVKLLLADGQIATATATGTGPVDAVYKAIDSLVKVPVELLEYSVKSVTEGIDAIGEVTVRIQTENRTFIGRGASTDIIVSSAKAYINALNKIVAVQAVRV